MQVLWISEARAMHRANCDAKERPSLCAIWTRTLMRRQLPNKYCEPPNEVNTFRTSKRKSKESADFGCQGTAHTRPLRSIVASHPSLDLAASQRLPLIKTNEQYRVRDAASRSRPAFAATRASEIHYDISSKSTLCICQSHHISLHKPNVRTKLWPKPHKKIP